MADELITKQELIDAKVDAKDLGEAVNNNSSGIVTPRYGASYLTAPAAVQKIQIDGANAIQAFQNSGNATIQYFQTEANEAISKVENTGGLISAPTLAALQAITPEYDYQLARVDATGDEYRWNPALTTTVKWKATGRNFLSESKVYVDEAIKALPIMLFDHPDFSVCIKDKNGQLALGLLLKKDGTPHQLMIDSIYKGMVDQIAQTVADKIGAMGYSLQESSDGSFFIVDKNQQMSYLGVTSNGLPHPYTIKCIKNALLESGFSSIPTTVKSTYQNTEIKAVSGPDIVCWGDSLTAGSGGNGTNYPSVLKTLLTASGSTANTYNMGVGGETSPTICARNGGNPFIIRITNGTIPADTTPVTVTLEDINGAVVRPLLQGSTTWNGKLGNIDGILNLVEPSGSSSSWQSDNYYTFTRKTAGTSITLNRPTPFYLDVAKPRLGDIHIIWIGQNNPSDGVSRHISDIKAIIQKMEALEKRWLVMPLPRTSNDTTSLADRNAYDSAMFAEFGRRFVSIRQYLCEFGLSDAGITPTTTDTANIAAGITPASLRVDSVHLNASGYTVVANQVFNRIKEMGWI